MLPSELQLRYASCLLEADEGSLPSYQAGEGSAVDSIVWSNPDLNVDWTYAVGWFVPSTTTSQLQGIHFAVRSYSSTEIVPVCPLPAAPADGDVFYLVGGLRFASGQDIPTARVNGIAPSLQAVSPSVVTGVGILHVESDVDLYIRFDLDADEVQLSVDGETWGDSGSVSVDASGGDVAGGYLQTSTGEWLVVDVDVSQLPAATSQEKLLVWPQPGTILPELWMDESDAVVHNFVILRNGGSTTEDVKIRNNRLVGSAMVASLYTDGDSAIALSSMVNIPGRDFWLYRSTGGPDLRYVTQRADGLCYVADTSKWQSVAFDAGTREPTIGTAVTAGAYTGTLRAVYITSGTWAGSNAAGLLIVSEATGAFANNEALVQGTQFALVNGTGSWGIRGITRQSTWSAAAVVRTYPTYDVRAVSPGSSNEFQTVEGSQKPLELSSLFAAWTFVTDHWEAETLSDFAPGSEAALILRRHLLAELEGNLGFDESLGFIW